MGCNDNSSPSNSKREEAAGSIDINSNLISSEIKAKSIRGDRLSTSESTRNVLESIFYLDKNKVEELIDNLGRPLFDEHGLNAFIQAGGVPG